MRRLFFALSLLVPAAAFAADARKPVWVLVHEEVVKPGAVAEYEAANRELIAAMTEKKINAPAVTFTTYATTDLHYFFLHPIASLADLDRFDGEWAKARDAVGPERFDALERRGSASVESYSNRIAIRRDDLEYVPASPRLKPEEQRFARIEYYYLTAGSERDAEAILRDYATLAKSRNVTQPFFAYFAVYGEDLPLLVAVQTGKSAADYAAADEQLAATLGPAAATLMKRTMAITRKVVRKDAMLRPDLSHNLPASAQ